MNSLVCFLQRLPTSLHKVINSLFREYKALTFEKLPKQICEFTHKFNVFIFKSFSDNLYLELFLWSYPLETMFDVLKLFLNRRFTLLLRAFIWNCLLFQFNIVLFLNFRLWMGFLCPWMIVEILRVVRWLIIRPKQLWIGRDCEDSILKLIEWLKCWIWVSLSLGYVLIREAVTVWRQLGTVGMTMKVLHRL